MLDWLKRLFKRKPKEYDGSADPTFGPEHQKVIMEERLDTPCYEGTIEETLKSHTTIKKYCVVCGMDTEHSIVDEGYKCKTCGHVKKRQPWVFSTPSAGPPPDVSKFFKGKGSKTTLKSYRKTVKNRVQPEEE